MEVQVKVFKDPTEEELNLFLREVDVAFVVAATDPATVEYSGGVNIYVFYRQ